MSWNILFANPQSDDLPGFFAVNTADLIALQELTSTHIETLSTHDKLRQHYPHQILWDFGIGGGMGLLSRYPILEQGRLKVPPILWARLDLGEGQTLMLVSAHPTFAPTRMRPEIRKPKPALPMTILQIFDLRFLWYDPDHRDDGIARVRRFIEPFLRQDEPLLLVGDFNVTEREPGYVELTAGLQDVYRAVGSGGGNTWRPERIAYVPFPILRIDYMLCSSAIRPLRMWVDRTPRGSDHCAIHGVFELSAPGSTDDTSHAGVRIQ